MEKKNRRKRDTGDLEAPNHFLHYLIRQEVTASLKGVYDSVWISSGEWLYTGAMCIHERACKFKEASVYHNGPEDALKPC